MPIGTNGNSVIKECGTHHIAIQTRDWTASLRLYQDVLGMKPGAEFGTPERKIVLLDTGDGSHIELFEPKLDTPAVDTPAANDPIIHFAPGYYRYACFVGACQAGRICSYSRTQGPYLR